jgi:AraC-like DNA-binding protein
MGTATGSLATAELLKRRPLEWPETVRFSTDDLPESERLPLFNEILGRQVMRLEVDPLPDHPFHSYVHMRRLPGLVIHWTTSSPRRIRRTRELLSDGNDNLFFQCVSGVRKVEHLGHEIFASPGDGIAYSCAETSSLVVHSDYRTVNLTIPRRALGFRLRDPDGCLARPLPGDSPEQRLLLGYLDLLQQEGASPTQELREAAVGHVYDLLVLALGAAPDAADVAKKRGVRAARLVAIKRSVRASLSDVTFSQITARHRLSPRYVQTLFEDEGTTFTQFVLDERLGLAWRILAGPRSAGRKVADIAASCGFRDLSYFNRKFRRRFGVSPSEIRAGAAECLPKIV